MKIISWNVNGIRANHKKGFIKFLKREKPDLLCLQEIKADADQFPEEILELSDYKLFINSAKKKGYSGTMIFSKEKPKKHFFKIGSKKFDEEGRVVRLDFERFSIIDFYIPQGGRKKENLPYKLESYEKIFSYIKKMKQKNIILIGDFNIAREEIDLARPKENKNSIMFTPEERKKIEKLLKLGFVDSYRQFNKEGGNYTWWPYFANARERNLGWRIDYVYVSRPLTKKLKDAFILKDVCGSDHCPLGIKIDL